MATRKRITKRVCTGTPKHDGSGKGKYSGKGANKNVTRARRNQTR